MRKFTFALAVLAACSTRSIEGAEDDAAKVLKTSASNVVCRSYKVHGGGCDQHDFYYTCYDLRSDRVVFCPENENIGCREEVRPPNQVNPEALGSP
jgi:hypothetical protein